MALWTEAEKRQARQLAWRYAVEDDETVVDLLGALLFEKALRMYSPALGMDDRKQVAGDLVINAVRRYRGFLLKSLCRHRDNFDPEIHLRTLNKEPLSNYYATLKSSREKEEKSVSIVSIDPDGTERELPTPDPHWNWPLENIACDAFWACVARLPKPASQALLLCYRDEMAQEKVARIMGKSRGNIGAILCRAKKSEAFKQCVKNNLAIAPEELRRGE